MTERQEIAPVVSGDPGFFREPAITSYDDERGRQFCIQVRINDTTLALMEREAPPAVARVIASLRGTGLTDEQIVAAVILLLSWRRGK